MPTDDLAIVPLTGEIWAPLEAFFREGGDPRWCWCMYWRRSAKDSRTATVAQQRDGLRALAEGQLPPGLVALRGDRAVGWVSLGPKANFERLQRSRVIPRLDDEPVWSIVCFAVSKTARGERLTDRLLGAAVDFARERGAGTLEAYPVDVPEGEAIDPNALYTGRLSVFVRAGFDVAAPTDSSAGGRPRVLVRRRLRPASSVALTSAEASA
jgi:GNAT superfamily N-acetyltransferase